MDDRERPPPYNEGFTNPGYGKPYAEGFKPLTMESQQQPPTYTDAEDVKPVAASSQPHQQAAYTGEFRPITTAPQPQLQQQPAYQYAPAFVPVSPSPQPQLHHHTTTSTNVVVVGGGGALAGCPICHNGKWTGTYSCCAWLWCLCCFPCGLICCLCMRKKKCTHCGYTVG